MGNRRCLVRLVNDSSNNYLTLDILKSTDLSTYVYATMYMA